jgi:hypothetical protein
MLVGRSGMSIIARAPIDCSTSNGIPEQVMCCYAKMGKFVSNTDGGGQVGVPVMDQPHTLFQYPHRAWYIIVTGIQQRCQYRYWHYTLVQYQYGHFPLPELASQHGARTGTGIFCTLVHY